MFVLRWLALMLAAVLLAGVCADSQAENSGQEKSKVPVQPDLSQPAWQRATVRDRNEFTGVPEDGQEAEEWLKKALAKPVAEPLVPGFVPVVVPQAAAPGVPSQVCLYRDHRGLAAVALAQFKDNQGAIVGEAGTIFWRSTPLERSLASILAKLPFRPTVNNWLTAATPAQVREMLCANGSVGIVTVDAEHVYAVDELPIVPSPQAFVAPPAGAANQQLLGLIKENALHAYGRSHGKIIWLLEGFDVKTQLPTQFHESHFLGPPLALDGQLYCLNEKNNGDLRLVCLAPATGAVNWLLPLGQMKEPYLTSGLRRTHPVQLASAEGLLLCPTHAGHLFAVDLAARRVSWTFAEHNQPAPPVGGNPFPNPNSPTPWKAYWQHARPIIHKGKVVFTAPEDGSVWCINLKNGKRHWSVDGKGDLYLAGVFGDRVLLVGSKTCRALALGSGEEKWTLPVGMPSGLGAAKNGQYYLPLRTGNPSGKAEVCVVDVAKGKVVRHLHLPADAVLGNLTFGDGVLISQTATTITAYPPQQAKKAPDSK